MPLPNARTAVVVEVVEVAAVDGGRGRRWGWWWRSARYSIRPSAIPG